MEKRERKDQTKARSTKSAGGQIPNDGGVNSCGLMKLHSLTLMMVMMIVVVICAVYAGVVMAAQLWLRSCSSMTKSGDWVHKTVTAIEEGSHRMLLFCFLTGSVIPPL